MSVDTLNKIRRKPPSGIGELRIARVVTSDPDPVTFVMEGTETALDASIFTIPCSVYPICKGDTFYVLPIAGSDNQRWGIISKINGTNAVGTMTSASACQVPGIGRPYTASELLLPPYIADNGNLHTGGYTRPLKAGDRVILFPVVIDGVVKYAVANHY